MRYLFTYIITATGTLINHVDLSEYRIDDNNVSYFIQKTPIDSSKFYLLLLLLMKLHKYNIIYFIVNSRITVANSKRKVQKMESRKQVFEYDTSSDNESNAKNVAAERQSNAYRLTAISEH